MHGNDIFDYTFYQFLFSTIDYSTFHILIFATIQVVTANSILSTNQNYQK